MWPGPVNHVPDEAADYADAALPHLQLSKRLGAERRDRPHNPR
jgi:hypothetical protein